VNKQYMLRYKKCLSILLLCCGIWSVQGKAAENLVQDEAIELTEINSQYLGCVGEYVVKPDKVNKKYDMDTLKKLPIVAFVCRENPQHLYLGINGKTKVFVSEDRSPEFYLLPEAFRIFSADEGSDNKLHFVIKKAIFIKRNFEAENQCLDAIRKIEASIYNNREGEKEISVDFSDLMTYTKCPSRGK
jgi:hypothetical protein